jgi:hypothetical protein
MRMIDPPEGHANDMFKIDATSRRRPWYIKQQGYFQASSIESGPRIRGLNDGYVTTGKDYKWVTKKDQACGIIIAKRQSGSRNISSDKPSEGG